MGVLQISLFGRFYIRYKTFQHEDLRYRKSQELLAYLLLYREQQHHREVLANLLWEDANQTQSKNYLRKAIWQLQSALNDMEDGLGEHLLLVADEWIRINPDAELQLDIAQFEDTFTCTQDIAGKEFTPTMLQAIDDAVQLYQGDLLEGWYQDWCLFERERLQQIYLHMLDKLMEYCEAHKEWERGLMYGSLILRLDVARERTHRRMMRIHYLARDRTSALRQFERCKESLISELNVKPSRLTMKLYWQIYNDPITIPRVLAVHDRADETAPKSLPGMLNQLEKLNRTLSKVQNQVNNQIKNIEAFMNKSH